MSFYFRATPNVSPLSSGKSNGIDIILTFNKTSTFFGRKCRGPENMSRTARRPALKSSPLNADVYQFVHLLCDSSTSMMSFFEWRYQSISCISRLSELKTISFLRNHMGWSHKFDTNDKQNTVIRI